MPFFSIIVPTYNRLDFLRTSVKSILAQSFLDYEVIIVDDGSTDQTVEAFQGDARVKVISQKNLGPGVARNNGVSEATGSYLAFLDSDDVWFPWTLATYQKILIEKSYPSFLVGKPYCFVNIDELTACNQEIVCTNTFRDYFSSGDKWRWWGVSSFVIKTCAFRTTAGFTNLKINGEDADLALKLGSAPGFVQITSPYTFAYRRHPDNVTKDTQKTVLGALLLVETEESGLYPGSNERAKERQRIISRHLRPIAINGLRSNSRLSWNIYIRSFRWNLLDWRLTFLLGFPLIALLRQLRCLSRK